MTQPKKLTEDQKKEVKEYVQDINYLIVYNDDDYLRIYNTLNFQLHLLNKYKRQIVAAFIEGFKSFLKGGDR